MLYMILFYYNHKREAKACRWKCRWPLGIFLYPDDFSASIGFCFWILLFGVELVDLAAGQKGDRNHMYVVSCLSQLYFLVKRISAFKPYNKIILRESCTVR